jgi:hypothetical protein
MRRYSWFAGLVCLLIPSAVAWSQQPSNSSLSTFGTGANPPSHIVQPPPVTPPMPLPQQVPAPSQPFSFLNFFKKISFPSIPFLSTSNGPAPLLPGQHPNAFNPLPPTTVLPTPVASPFIPVSPTTTLPTPVASPLVPLPPFTPNQ